MRNVKEKLKTYYAYLLYIMEQTDDSKRMEECIDFLIIQ